MDFSRATIFSLLIASNIFFYLRTSWMSAAIFALLILVFLGSEVFHVADKTAEIRAKLLSLALTRAEKNEDRLAKLVEAGLRMEQKINEMEARQTLNSVERFAGVKR